MSAESLQAALEAIGIRAEVRQQERVALLRTAPDERALERPEVRRQAALLALEHGFMAIALEVGE